METKDQTVLTDTQKEGIYKTACAKMRGVKNADMQREAIALFRTIPGYRDADGQIAVCEQRIRALEEKEEAERSEAERRKKKRKTALAIALPVLAVLLAIAVLLPLVILPGIRYAKATKLYHAGEYEKAIPAFEAMRGYRDSEAMIAECRYGAAADLFDAGEYEAAAGAFAALDGYRDSAVRVEACEAAYREQRYAEAETLAETGRYDEAYPIWTSLNGYRDSAQRASDIYEQYKVAALKNAAVGDYILFGAYEQDNDPSNGAEDIEWLVLARDNEGVLAVSRYVLDFMQYTTSEEAVSWEECSLQKWLNDTFYNSAFRADDQRRIRDTIGKVFLLSTSEANKYMDSDAARRCAPTAYAIARGAITSSTYRVDGKDTCGWWLRNVYRTNFNAATITIEGAVSTLDVDLWLAFYGVRPALWINIE